ncbi:MAG: aminotransferase class I and II [Austwickia sp.]|nr:aminotransferase class I and II [Austwickia sp.]
MLPHVDATRYVAPFREGGSLPGLVEATDLGMYVVKFRGAGQGLKVLVAEVICAGLARALQVRTPDLVTITLPEPIARYEADEEVQDLLTASPGSNLGIDFLPGAFGYDGARPPDPDEAAAIVWLDALTANVDRTWANPNLLVWGGHTWAIDSGAALYFHHSWPRRAPDAARFAAQPYDAGAHVLAEVSADVRAAHDRLAARLPAAVLESVVADVPQEWLEPTDWLPDAAAVRTAYLQHLTARLAAPAAWLPNRGATR